MLPIAGMSNTTFYKPLVIPCACPAVLLHVLTQRSEKVIADSPGLVDAQQKLARRTLRQGGHLAHCGAVQGALDGQHGDSRK